MKEKINNLFCFLGKLQIHKKVSKRIMLTSEKRIFCVKNINEEKVSQVFSSVLYDNSSTMSLLCLCSHHLLKKKTLFPIT
jgi:hypothetical protein